MSQTPALSFKINFRGLGCIVPKFLTNDKVYSNTEFLRHTKTFIHTNKIHCETEVPVSLFCTDGNNLKDLLIPYILAAFEQILEIHEYTVHVEESVDMKIIILAKTRV